MSKGELSPSSLLSLSAIQINKCYFTGFFFLIFYFLIEWQILHRERDREESFICWIVLQVASIAGAEVTHSWEPGASSTGSSAEGQGSGGQGARAKDLTMLC